MLRVLLVDDEPYIRQGLRVMVDWREEGFEIAGEASNGQEAVAYLKENEVDLIIADIKMPGMGGMELMEHIYENDISHAHFVILSGFYEFRYAQTAIRYRCTDYILKPIQKEDLLGLLKKVAGDCDLKQKSEVINREKERALFDQHMQSLIWGKFDRLNVQYIIGHIRLSGQIRYINMEPDLRENPELSEAGKRNIQRELYQRCLKLLGSEEQHVIFDVTKHESCYDVGLLYCDYLADEKGMNDKEYLKWFADRIREEVNYPILVHVGNSVNHIEAISESYRTANVAKSFQVFRNDKDITFYEKELEQNKDFFLEKQKMDSLVRTIEANERAQITAAVDILYEEINSKQMDVNLIQMQINYFLYQLIHLAMEQDDNVNQEEILKYISSAAFYSDGIRGSSEQFKTFALEYADYLVQLRQNASRGVLQDIEREIAENYQENLSLKTLSEKYFINSAYLGQIFKKQFGQGFKEYLNSYRLERAAELLLRTDEKVYAIAESVGYHNLDYFINKFVAQKGCTPTKYRKQATTADTE